MTESPQGRRRTVRLCAAGLAVLALTAGGLLIYRGESPTIAKDDAHGVEVADGCVNETRAACRSVMVGPKEVRYALAAPKGAPDDGTAIVLDVGGPGTSVLNAGYPATLIDDFALRFPGTTILLIEEPWVTGDPSAECVSAMSAWLTEGHRGSGDEPRDLRAPCQIGEGQWGWDPPTYRTAVRAILDRESLTLDGFVGYSFGAQRSRYLGDALDWALLVNPSPYDIGSKQYLMERYDGALAALAGHCGCTVSEAELRLEQRAAKLVEDPVVVAGRSVPVTRMDIGAAVLGLPYLSTESQAALAQQLLTEGAADLIGGAADSVWARFGEYSVSPGYLAYLDEVCPAIGSVTSDEAPVERTGVVASVLVLMHSSCGDVALLELSRPQWTCVSFNTDDAVSPRPFAESWRAAGSVLVERAATSHDDTAGLGDCVDRLQTQRAG
ncbi:hypothetical protein [Oerskovia jenensis]|uniref:hypothetical protein n=1 Tax=Oerskovia jenensis TaxID=162169 RepID=UPI0036DE1679